MSGQKKNLAGSKSVTMRPFGRAFPVWLIVSTLVLSGAGAAAGTVLAGGVSGRIPVAVSQALLVDGRAFGVDDVSYGNGKTIKRAIVATSDSDSEFQAAAEIGVGDKFLITLPLQNQSKTPVVGLITLEPSSPPGLQLTVVEHSVLSIALVSSEDAAARGAPLTVGTHIYNTRYWSLADNDNDGDIDAGDVVMAVTGAGSSVTVSSVNALMGQITYTISGAEATSLTISYKYGSEVTILAQTGPNQWKFKADNTLGSNKSGDIEIVVANPDNASPGYYHVRGTIEEIGH